MIPLDTSPTSDAIQIEIYRRIGGDGRLLLAASLSGETLLAP